MKALDSFDARLRMIKTNKDIRRTILAHGRGWMNDTRPTRRPIPPNLRTVIRDQTTLGWDQFMKGRIVKTWAPLQAADFVSHQLCNTGKSWAAALTLAIWELAW
jgi:hypothetical protein